jgi:DNA polymerase
LKAEEEVKDIFSHLKRLIMAHQEMGLEPPPIPVCSFPDIALNSTQAGAEDEISSELAYSDRLDHLDSLEALREHIGECQRCKLKKERKHLVFGEMGLTREEVYICNVVKCRPPRNRDPEMDEIEACLPFLQQQLNIIRPEVICVLGRIAGQNLLRTDFKITKERGKWHSYMDIPVMPTYHPAFIVRNRQRERELKGQVWEDIKQIMTHLGLEVKKNG